jgi:hypothetical protein
METKIYFPPLVSESLKFLKMWLKNPHSKRYGGKGRGGS